MNKSNKRILMAMLIFILTCAFIFGACERLEEVSRDIIDSRYTSAHDEIETTYEYHFNLLGEDTWTLMPNTHTVHYDEKYELLYHITYSNGSVKDKWEEVTPDEYKNYLNKETEVPNGR